MSDTPNKSNPALQKAETEWKIPKYMALPISISELNLSDKMIAPTISQKRVTRIIRFIRFVTPEIE